MSRVDTCKCASHYTEIRNHADIKDDKTIRKVQISMYRNSCLCILVGTEGGPQLGCGFVYVRTASCSTNAVKGSATLSHQTNSAVDKLSMSVIEFVCGHLTVLQTVFQPPMSLTKGQGDTAS